MKRHNLLLNLLIPASIILLIISYGHAEKGQYFIAEEKEYDTGKDTDLKTEAVMLRDCPHNLDETSPSRTVSQIINNTFHRWKELELENGEAICIIKEKPEYRRLSANEARKFLKESGKWVAQDCAVGMEPGTDYYFDPEEPEGIPAVPPPYLETYFRISADAVIGRKDERQRVQDRFKVTSYPWHSTGYVEVRFSDGLSRGTGFLIGPNTILTCGHNIDHPRQDMISRFEFKAGKHRYGEGYLHKGLRTTLNWDMHPGWKNNYGSSYDLAVAFIDEPYKHVETYMPVQWDHEPDFVIIAGYPLEVRDEKTRDQWFDYGDVINIKKRTLHYEVDTSRGNSGSPVWVRSTIDGTAHFRLVGVHVQRSPHIPNIYNVGVRLVSEDRDLLEKWMQGKPIGPVESVALSADPPSPTAPGQRITFTAEAAGGFSPEYAFYYKRAGSNNWKIIQTYSTQNTLTLTPGSEGEYNIGVRARSFGSKNHEAQLIIEHVIEDKFIEPVKAVALSADPSSPTVSGQQITFTAEAEGGVNPEFRFYYRPRGGSWKPFGSFSPDSTFTTSTRTTGDFEVGVLARSSGSIETIKDTIYHTISP